MKRRHTKRHSRSRSSLKVWLFRLVGIACIGLFGWWGVTAALAVSHAVKTYPTSTPHSFITSTMDNPVYLIAQQSASDAAQLQSLAIMRVWTEDRGFSILQLPTDLSDGQTTAADYLQNGYYKELQQLVEQTLALPINGYIIQPSGAVLPEAQSWSALFLRQPKPSWWQTTASAPWWLLNQPEVRTNLSPWQFIQTVWLVRDADDSRITIQSIDAAAFSRTDKGMTVGQTDQLDPLVERTLVDQQAVNQGVSIVVKNATDVPGLAALTARYAHHLGGEVVAVEPADSGQANTTMTAEKSTRLTAGLTNLLGVPLTVAAKTGRERADVELVVGVDVLNRLGQPR